MSKKDDNKYTIGKITLNLTVACFACSLIIALVYFITAPVAAKNAKILKDESMKALIQDANDFEVIKGKSEMYEALKDNKTIGYITQSESKGYGGTIKLLVAVDTKGQVIAYNVLSHNETPGLGDKTTKSPFKDQFKGKDIDQLVVTKDPSNKNDVQAITGATISSKAVTEGVHQATEQVNEYIGGK